MEICPQLFFKRYLLIFCCCFLVGIEVVQDVEAKRALEAKRCLEDRQLMDMHMANSAVGQTTVTHVGRRPPRPFLKQQRTLVEKFVDFLLGDGPSHRLD